MDLIYLKSQGLKALSLLSVFCLSEVFYRFYQIFKEKIFYHRHYPTEGRNLKIIKHSIAFNDCTKYLMLVTMVMFSCALMAEKNFLNNLLELSYFVPIYMIVRFAKIYSGPVEAAEWIRSNSGLDYGTGMVSSYFHGYLNLILPHKGDGVKGIAERLRDYEDKQGVKLAIRKLLIIVPDSMLSPPKIERAEALEAVIRDRAGVERRYDNAVYRFKHPINGRHYYICVEGATPLQTFRESMRSWTSTPLMKALYKEIVIQFYKSLKACIQSCPETENECEIIYYPDSSLSCEQRDVGLYLQKYVENRVPFYETD